MDESTQTDDAARLSADEGMANLAAQGLRLPDNWDAVVADALHIQPRFNPEPIFAKTGVGFMRSVGVSELEAAKNNMVPSQTHAGREGP